MEKKCCYDFYGEKLFIGDKVSSVLSGSRLSNTEGIIQDISYLEETDQYFLTLVDSQGTIIGKKANSSYYSTRERINQYGNDYIFCLSFINKEGKIISNQPLTTNIAKDLQIPKNTLWIDLKINKLISRNLYERYTLFVLIIDSDLSSHFRKKEGKYCITTSKFIYYPNFTDSNMIIFENKERLQSFIKVLINFFHNNPMGQTNNHKLYDENNEACVLSKKLTKLIANEIKK